MISSLKGKVKRVRGNEVEIEVNGVGYEVYGPAVAKALVGKVGEEISVKTYMAVSENEIKLYGFENYEDLDLFRMLITVSGVGPKTAAGILAEKQSGEITKAIGEADVEFFKKMKGVGLKTAQRIIVDLKSKITGIGVSDSAFAQSFGESKEDDVILSLQQLGFEKKEIEVVYKKIPTELVETEDRISWCLQNIK